MNTFENGWAYIHQATKMGYTKSVEKMMRSQGELLDLETQDSMRETPLHIAVKYKESNLDTVRVLVELGANVTALNAQNHGVVELACLTFNVAALRYFIQLDLPSLPVWRRLLGFVRSDLEEESQKAGACIRELTKPVPIDGQSAASSASSVPLSATAATTSTTATTTNPNWRSLYESGGVPVLVGVVKGGPGDLAAVQALHCLINVAERSEVKQQIVSVGGLGAFVRHLRSATPSLVELSAIALRLVCDVGEYADQACAQGALPALVAALRTHASGTAPRHDVLVAVVTAIGALAEGSDARQTLFGTTPDGVDALCSLFHDCLHQPLLLALNRAVSRVARRHRANQDAIVGGGALDLVVMLCDVKNREIQLSAVRAVHSLVEGNASAQRAMRREGAVAPLLQLLRKSGSQDVLERTAGALWALAGDEHEDRRAMAGWIGVETLIEFVGALSETLHFVGSEGLGVLAQGACNRQAAIADANGVHPLIRLLKSDKEYLVLSAVRSLRHLCVGVGYVPHRRNQTTVAQSRGIRLLVALLSLSKSELVQVEAALTLGAVALGEQQQQQQQQRQHQRQRQWRRQQWPGWHWRVW